MPTATAGPTMASAIHSVGIALVLGTSIGLVRPAAAQTPAGLDETAVYRTWQVFTLSEACSIPAVTPLLAGVPGGTCTAIRSFVASPLTSMPPSAATLDAAYRAAGQHAATALGTFKGTMILAGSTGPPTFGPRGFGAAFVSGLTEFLLERARDEVVNTFFRDLEKLFEKHTPLAVAFPRTRRSLQGMDQLGYRTLIPTLHGAVRADLEALPENLLLAHALFPQGIPVIVQAAGAATGPVRAIASGGQPLRALSMLTTPPSSVTDVRLKDALRIVGRLAAELEAGAVQDVSGVLRDMDFTEALAALLTRPDYRNVLLAFLLQDLGALDATVRSALTARSGLADIIARLNELRATLEGQADPRFEATAAERVASVLAASLQVIRAGESLLPEGDRPALRQGLEVADALVRALTTQQWGAFVAEVLRLIPVSDDGRPVTRLITLAAAIASSDDPTEIKDALHAAADPVGSFRARRRKGGSVAAVAYLGGSVGAEWIRGADTGDGAGSGFAGAALPVGVEIAGGTGWGFPSSVGLFLSVLDVGTLASYRLSTTTVGTDSVAATPEYGIAHVLAPGAYLVLGVSRSRPISVGVGVQYAPRLRAITDVVEDPLDTVRLSFFLALDLTLLRF